MRLFLVLVSRRTLSYRLTSFRLVQRGPSTRILSNACRTFVQLWCHVCTSGKSLNYIGLRRLKESVKLKIGPSCPRHIRREFELVAKKRGILLGQFDPWCAVLCGPLRNLCVLCVKNYFNAEIAEIRRGPQRQMMFWRGVRPWSEVGFRLVIWKGWPLCGPAG